MIGFSRRVCSVHGVLPLTLSLVHCCKVTSQYLESSARSTSPGAEIRAALSISCSEFRWQQACQSSEGEAGSRASSGAWSPPVWSRMKIRATRSTERWFLISFSLSVGFSRLNSSRCPPAISASRAAGSGTRRTAPLTCGVTGWAVRWQQLSAVLAPPRCPPALPLHGSQQGLGGIMLQALGVTQWELPWSGA